MDVGSSTSLVRNTLVNNGSGGYGPAVYDRYNVGVEIQENSACGNKVTIEGSVATSRCDGVYAFVGRRRATCLPFAHECIAPTPPPSLSPTKAPTVPTNVPSVKPSVAPSRSPTQQPSTYPTLSPSYIPSASIMPTVGPSLTPVKSQLLHQALEQHLLQLFPATILLSIFPSPPPTFHQTTLPRDHL